MLDERERNLQRYALHLEKKDLVFKGKKKKNDLKNILYFPSLYWFNGQFCPPIPYFSFERHEGGKEEVGNPHLEDEKKKRAFRVNMVDLLTCGVHKNSVIVKRVVKNEVLNVSMFSNMKVVSCVFYVNIEYLMGLDAFFGTKTNPFFFCLSLATLGTEDQGTGETQPENKRRAHEAAKGGKRSDGGAKIESLSPLNLHPPLLSCDIRNALDMAPRQLFLYNEKKEIHLFDYVTNKSLLITREKIQVTALQFSFLHISEYNNLYNKMETDMYEGGIRIVDLDKVGKQLWSKNRYCFEVLEEWLSGEKGRKNQPNEEEAPCGECGVHKILGRMFYVLIYGDSEGNVYFLIPEKEVKMIKNFRRGKKIQLIETNVKAYFNTGGESRIATVLRSNVNVFLAYRDCILVFNFPLYEPLFVVNVADEVIFCLSACLNEHGEVYFAFSTQRCVRIGEVSRGGDVFRVEVDTTQVDNTKEYPPQGSITQVQHSANRPHISKQQKSHICVCFGRENDLYITSGDKGTIHRYNLKKKQMTHKYDPRCKRIFHLSMCTVNGEDYAYIYDAEKFLCLFQLTKQKNVYKVFTLSVWVYQILCLRTNIIFSLGNENVYSLEVKKEGNNNVTVNNVTVNNGTVNNGIVNNSTVSQRNGNLFLTKPFYSDRMSVCTYMTNHPYLPFVAFLNKKLQFGFFSLVDSQRKSVIVPPIRENGNVFSLCWFSTRKQLDILNFQGGGEDLTVGDPLTLNQFKDEWTGGIIQNRGYKNKKKDDNIWINAHMAHLMQNSSYDTYLVVLNADTLFLYNILTSQVIDLKDYLKKAMPQFDGKNNFLKSTIYGKVCYVFIFSEKNKLFIFDQNFTFCLRTISVDDRIVRFYLRDGYLFIHSNTSIYFTSLRNALSLFPDVVQGGDAHAENLLFIKVNTAETFKIVLFDFLCVGEEMYLAVFTKRKEILVYRMRMGVDDNKEDDTVKGTENGRSAEAQLVGQFLSFYKFEHLNKVGSILSMKFFYCCTKRRTYLIFGGLEQFLFFWDFAKYPLVRR
ncbi:conserved Plasmodium protein, unknown function [Plasmodium knowlesi strain H]|uniref:Uncharacterized protein n=3 Tax=Plasmodium knowlesi TaxID=5850 RepID=A0A5K1U7A9_PLAKH|nr:WD repeat-containing protein, putative [Plasmodium knowlesi strain H]OTN64140.1 Uncharacterized protein PKNOH_S140269600 [Plasmodium knowlesi]CAA9991109.1 WD repeat-containing protein, putative [Plasmodium knowlesi strain H]SBO20585.1 conserved Plasmodium protein, unknown function [Plasmodium knowlesi strain H]SBO20976.1 conserved Plasmodium protein, unknown function [Plasmodium knowlesi strain H]VVS80583.1 WD repeat-containing protein, putative [Plasmodium knowlesi strain H]|eukprot:XP_002262393.1 hypothetical protein, conserved in Plasmodium species [Plasmodium knowlesi strain H]